MKKAKRKAADRLVTELQALAVALRYASDEGSNRIAARSHEIVEELLSILGPKKAAQEA